MLRCLVGSVLCIRDSSKAALERGLYLMTHWNMIMVCPPLTVTRDELEEGIAILDDVLSIADEYYAD
jgi:taurine--2-oxoglutarate transaminase